MSKKGHRDGGKFGGNHTTFIPLARVLVDVAAKEKEVTNISAGFIKAGLTSVNGQRRVKITDTVGGVFLSIRDNASHQEVRIYTTDIHKTKLALSRATRNNGIHLCFGKVE